MKTIENKAFEGICIKDLTISWTICYTQKDIDDVLNNYLNLSNSDRQSIKKWADEIRTQCFEPIKDETLNVYIEGLNG